VRDTSDRNAVATKLSICASFTVIIVFWCVFVFICKRNIGQIKIIINKYLFIIKNVYKNVTKIKT